MTKLSVGTVFKFVNEDTGVHSESFIVKNIDAHGDYWVDFYERMTHPRMSDILMPWDTIIRNSIIIINNKTDRTMERNLKMTIEQAQKLYAEQPSMRELLLTTFSEEELEGVVLKDWSELGRITGYYIHNESEIHYNTPFSTKENRNVFYLKKQAKSALAMAQLSQLMKDLGSECEVDWNDDDNHKCAIIRHGDVLTYPTATNSHYAFLAFKTVGVCCAFAKKHDRLIRDYFMLD